MMEVEAPSFCPPHWDLLRVHQPDGNLLVATVRALQLGTEKVATEKGWGPNNLHDVSEVGPIAGPCWVCHFGVGFLNELDDFIARPPAWARVKPSAEAEPAAPPPSPT